MPLINRVPVDHGVIGVKLDLDPAEPERKTVRASERPLSLLILNMPLVVDFREKETTGAGTK